MRKSPRVLFVSLHFARMGGLEIYNLEAAKSLMRYGARVEAVSVFTSQTGDCEGIPTRGLAPASPTLNRIYYRLWRHLLTAHLARLKGRYDLVIAGHLYVLPQAAAFASRQHALLWLGVHGIEVWKEWPQSVHAVIRRCHKIVAVSSYTAHCVRCRLGQHADPVRIIHNTVNTDLFFPRPSSLHKSSLCVLTVGRLAASEQYKGHDLIIAALPKVIEKIGRPVEYWIVGDGDDLPRLQALASRAGAPDSIRFWGKVSIEKLIEIYNACDVFAMPSRVERKADGSWAGEGFGIVYIEAAACGKPVIAANQGGALDAVRDGLTGLLVEPNREAVADALVRLLRDETLRRRMGAAGRQFVVENFSPAVFNRQWANLLKEQGL